MGPLSPLERYRAYLDSLNKYARDTPEDERVDLLGPGEVVDLLVIRDKLSAAKLDAQRRRELDRLDDLLLKHRTVIVGNIPPYPYKPRSHWWWHLDEGPQVREQALAAAKDD